MICPRCGRPQIVDLYCGAGGAAVGYRRAGFCVALGVDHAPQPDYPFRFLQADVLDVLDTWVAGGTVEWIGPGVIDAVHASPPCQNETALTRGNRSRNGWTDDHRPMIPATRDRLELLRSQWGIPYVIENTQGAPLRRDLTLCGLQFRLRVFRHRYFELGGWAMQPATCSGGWNREHAGHRVAGWRHGVRYAGDMVAVYGDGGGKGSPQEWSDAMGGLDWIVTGTTKQRKRAMAEAIPPAYSQHVGRGLLAYLRESGRVAA